jgi:hypothetical protein
MASWGPLYSEVTGRLTHFEPGLQRTNLAMEDSRLEVLLPRPSSPAQKFFNVFRFPVRRDLCRPECALGYNNGRPYQKNDNAWIEQKNWTHVRKVVDYRRFDNTIELRLLNEIYGVLRLYKNFFLPTIKLASKTRVNGRIKRTYSEARTPYHRLVESRQIERKTKQQLQAIYESLNPAELQRRLSHLREQLEKASAAKSESC